jgi:lysophospholipase L1-like esterase
MLSVLAADDATIDTIHLSPAGHQSMCDAVFQLLSSAWPKPTSMPHPEPTP